MVPRGGSRSTSRGGMKKWVGLLVRVQRCGARLSRPCKPVRRLRNGFPNLPDKPCPLFVIIPGIVIFVPACNGSLTSRSSRAGRKLASRIGWRRSTLGPKRWRLFSPWTSKKCCVPGMLCTHFVRMGERPEPVPKLTWAVNGKSASPSSGPLSSSISLAVALNGVLRLLPSS
jgi:hypothetical protein